MSKSKMVLKSEIEALENEMEAIERRHDAAVAAGDDELVEMLEDLSEVREQQRLSAVNELTSVEFSEQVSGKVA